MTYLLASRDGNQLNESMMYMMAPASPLRVGTRLKQGDVIVNAWFRDNEIRGWQTGALRGYSYKHMADIPVILRRQEQYRIDDNILPPSNPRGVAILVRSISARRARTLKNLLASSQKHVTKKREICDKNPLVCSYPLSVCYRI